MNELQTSPPQEQETSARAELIETRRGQTGGHNKNHMNSRNDRISRNTRIAKEQKENKKEETSEGRKEELGPEKTTNRHCLHVVFIILLTQTQISILYEGFYMDDNRYLLAF